MKDKEVLGGACFCANAMPKGIAWLQKGFVFSLRKHVGILHYCTGHIICLLANYFSGAPSRAIPSGHFTPRYAPLQALAWGYYCFALRAVSLRDGIP